ncbi:unnamed protein product [Rodentolepis nana]|uniref:Protein YIPF3 n=1 Tax=Rodentolepis nana TaxID=102285 RepID=A0A0R3T0K3_RODNA|nr:unnamed protein product [Rodentolepis nana]
MLPTYNDGSSPQTVQRGVSRPNMATSELFSALSASVWSEGKKRAESAYQNYAKIDSLRPFFDVEPREVLARILKSVDPRSPYNLDATNTDLYGPFMACLTLIAVILFEMKLSNHQVQEGTLMGSAFLTCFGYWLLTSSLLLVACYFGNSQMNLVHLLSSVARHFADMEFVLPVLFCLFAPLFTMEHQKQYFSCFGLYYAAMLMWNNIPLKTPRITGCIFALSSHMLFVIYLHFAYHTIVQGKSKLADLKQFL